MKTYDTAVIGSGLVGLSAAYELAKAGQKVALIEARGLSSGSSSANTGLLLFEGEQDENIFAICADGVKAYEGLADELGRDIGFSSLPFLSVFTNDDERRLAEKSAAFYSSRGYDYRLLSAAEVKEFDPLLNAEGILGGALFRQWRMDPLKTVFAWFARARELGMDWLPFSKAEGFTSKGGRILSVKTQTGEIRAGQYLAAAGAWTRELFKTLGIFLPDYYIHGAAMVLERRNPEPLNHAAAGFTSPRM
jgi:sarcosine oxidase subunit beta